ncbi:MAG: ferredoxin, partial [Duncaniella sp.]|nr:ferredoxin [Duncaniella sp.]
MSVILTSVLILGGIGVVGAAVLYVVANRFKVEEDPRIDEIEALLPGANCGGCGRSGCRDFAVACVKATGLDSLVCPASGNGVMKRIAEIVGLAAVEGKPRVAVLKCNGTCSMRTRVASYD